MVILMCRTGITAIRLFGKLWSGILSEEATRIHQVGDRGLTPRLKIV